MEEATGERGSWFDYLPLELHYNIISYLNPKVIKLIDYIIFSLILLA